MSTRPTDEAFEREVGASLLAWIAVTSAGRWRGPRGALEYVKVTEGTTDALVRDFVAWASGYSDHLVPGARDRMEALAQELLAGVGSAA
jgi:hypothetical protein